MGNRFTKKAIVVGGATADLFPAPITNAGRAPTTTDTDYELGQKWIFDDTEYTNMGDGVWDAGGVGMASTTEAGIVRLATVAETTAGVLDNVATTPAGVAAVAIAGAPLWSEVTAGIVQRATTAQAQAGALDTVGMSPLKTAQLFATPPAIGSTTPAAGTFTDLTANGTISLDTTAATHYTITGANDMLLNSTAGSVDIAGGRAAADAVTIQAAAGGLDVDTALLLSLVSSRNNAQAIQIEATAGGIDILASGATAGEDIDITATGSSVNITSSENTADAIVLNASAGGIDITATGGAAEDIDITNTAGSIRLTSGEAVADSMVFASSGGIDADAAGQVNVRSTQNAVDSIVIESTVGGIDILASGATAGEDIDIIATGSSVNIESTEDAALAVYLHANGGTSETIRLRADQGIGVASVDILSDVGGITLTAGLASADAINIVASNAAGGIDIDSGTAGVIVDTTGAASIDAAAASNFSVSGAGVDLTLASSGGRVVVNGEEAAADAVRILSAAGGLDTDVALQLSLVSSQAAASDSIRVQASAADGGIDVDAGTGGITLDSTGAISIDGGASSNVAVSGAGIDLTLDSAAGQLVLTGGEAAANAVRIQADNAAGGIDVDAGTAGITIDTTGALSIDSAGTTNLTATGAFDLTVQSTAGSVIVSASEDVADALQLLSTAGGIDILATGSAAQDIDIVNTGGSVNITATENASDALVITASGAASGITLSAGTGGVNVAGDLNLTSVATKISMNGGAATDFIGRATLVAGTVTVANTNIAANDRIFLTRSALNGSPALGFPITTISAGASFTIDSYSAAGAAVATDVSTFDYVIVRQT